MIPATTRPSLLPIERIKVYRQRFNVRVIPQVRGKVFRYVDPNLYFLNFHAFVKRYFLAVGSTPAMVGMIPHGPQVLQPNSMGYHAFKRYALTVFGSSMIDHMLQTPYNFIVCEGVSASDARADYKQTDPTCTPSAINCTYDDLSKIFLPKKFPSQPFFPTTNQPVYDLAIIHHEFHHSGVWQNMQRYHQQVILQEERAAVIFAENPARLSANYEPRYCYYRNTDFTINIMTGEILPGNLTVNRYDIRQLVMPTDKDALT